MKLKISYEECEMEEWGKQEEYNEHVQFDISGKEEEKNGKVD